MFIYIFRKLLQIIFVFDKWHLNSSINRSYCIGLVNFLNQRIDKNSVAEIGCGLGDIINQLDYKNIHGFDIDNRVLKAAKIINFFKKRKIVFSRYVFPDQKLNNKFHIIIMVNWIHHIKSEILKNEIEYYFNNNIVDNGALIIDTVLDIEYKFNHDVIFLTNTLNCKLEKIGEYERGRMLWSINKI